VVLPSGSVRPVNASIGYTLAYRLDSIVATVYAKMSSLGW